MECLGRLADFAGVTVKAVGVLEYERRPHLPAVRSLADASRLNDADRAALEAARVVSRAEVRRAESGAPRSLQLIWSPPALHARILESPLDRNELVDEDGSGGGCAGIVEEAERSEHHLR